MTDNIKIEYINQHHRFFQDVINLGKKHSSTLGFMPEGGFTEYAQKKCIIIAHNNSELIGYLMFRIVSRSSRLSIVHLCVNENFRGQKASIKLLDALREKYQATFSGISLNCRVDYLNATSLWQKYGFVSKNKKRSRSIEENHLYTWWYDFNNPDLFSSAWETSLKIKAILDANIIVKLRDSHIVQNPSEDPRPLLADWLMDEVDYLYAPELLNEITRDKNNERANKTRNFLTNFEAIRFNVEECKHISNDLKSIIHGNTDNDKSDRIQLASAITSKTPYFITFDNKMLEKKEIIEEKYDIHIFTPQEFLLEIDQLLNKEDYSPLKLKGVTFHSISKVSNNELDNYIDLFLAKSCSEKKNSLKNIVYSEASQVNLSNIKVIKHDNNAIAFFAYKIKNATLNVPFIRLTDTSQNHTLFMQLISDFINKSINENLQKIEIEEKYLSENQKLILRQLGFEYQALTWRKILFNMIIESSRILEINCELLDSSIISNFEDKSTDEKQNILLNFERKFFPLKFSDLDIPCYIIPIKPYWAGQLFDTYISGAILFGANPDKIWNMENVYYRHVKPITETAPARILWYASEEKNCVRSQSIIASSFLDEVMTDKPKVLFQKNKHYGIYDWKNIYDLCEHNIEKDIRALRFSHTEVFNKSIKLSTIRQIFIANGKKTNTFASPVKINKNIFHQIYQLRNGNN